MERRDRFILLRSTCTVKMQSRLARQRIHQHTRAHETAVPSLPWDLDVEAEGVVYPVLPLRYQLAPILSTKDSTFLIDKDGRDVSRRRICRNDAEAKENATSVGVRIKREKRKQEEAAGKVTGLKLLYISVPPYSFRGQSALLECRYDLEADKLYSITWYKDHEEFYRYVPRGEPTKHSYRVEGVKVDHRKSNDKEVLLQDVSLHSSGRYKCEVSAEAPSFNSVSAEASMEVAVLPQDGPSITGEEKVYATGDVLGLNCTSGKSHPAATLKWFINREQVKPDTEMVFEQHGLYSVISSLRLQLEPDHIAGDKINVRCEATVVLDSMSDKPRFETRTTEVFVEGQGSLATPSVCLTVASALLLRLLPTWV